MFSLHQVDLAFLYCVKIGVFLIQWNGLFVHANQTYDNKILHRRAIGSTKLDITAGITLGHDEYVQDAYMASEVVCDNYVYRKYINSYPNLLKIELTQKQLDELMYEILFNSMQTYFLIEIETTYELFVSEKNFPDIIKNNLEHNFVEDLKFLDGNFLNLELCRVPQQPMAYNLIFTETRKKIPSLANLLQKKILSTTTSPTKKIPTPTTTTSTTTTPTTTTSTTPTTTTSTTTTTTPTTTTTSTTTPTTTASKTPPTTPTTTPTTTLTTTTPTTTTTVTRRLTNTTPNPELKDCSVDMIDSKEIMKLTKNELSRDDWISALYKYNQTDRPACLNQTTTQLLKTCLCRVNFNFQTWVCDDQDYKAMEFVLDISPSKYYIALDYLIEVRLLCVDFTKLLE